MNGQIIEKKTKYKYLKYGNNEIEPPFMWEFGNFLQRMESSTDISRERWLDRLTAGEEPK